MTRSDFMRDGIHVFCRTYNGLLPVWQLKAGDCIEDRINEQGWIVTKVNNTSLTVACGGQEFSFPIHEDKPMDTSLPDESATQPCKCNCVNKFNEIINRAYSECLHNSTGKDLMIEIQHLLILELMGEKE